VTWYNVHNKSKFPGDWFRLMWTSS